LKHAALIAPRPPRRLFNGNFDLNPDWQDIHDTGGNHADYAEDSIFIHGTGPYHCIRSVIQMYPKPEPQ